MRKRSVFFFAVGAVLTLAVVRACEFNYTIWAIRNKPADPLFRFVKNAKAGYIDVSGKVVIPATFPAHGDFAGEFHDGMLAVPEGRGYRYVDRFGKVVFRFDAEFVLEFSEGLAPAEIDYGSPNRQSRKWGFIDRSGQLAIAPQYGNVTSFSEGLARVSLPSTEENTGYIDHQGKFVIPPRLSYGSDFHEDRAAVVIGRPCVITNGGSCERLEFRPRQLPANYDCRYAFVDKRGDPVSALRFDDAKDFSEGLAPVKVGTKWGFVDHSGQMSIQPRFQSAEPFSDGVSVVEDDGQKGFVDHTGNYVIRPQFQSAESFSEGLAVVAKSNGPGLWTNRFIDKSGKPAFPGDFPIAESFTYGLASVALDRKGNFAWIDKTGKLVFRYHVRR